MCHNFKRDRNGDYFGSRFFLWIYPPFVASPPASIVADMAITRSLESKSGKGTIQVWEARSFMHQSFNCRSAK